MIFQNCKYDEQSKDEEKKLSDDMIILILFNFKKRSSHCEDPPGID